MVLIIKFWGRGQSGGGGGALAEVTFGLVHARYSLPFICRTDPLHQLEACVRGGGEGRREGGNKKEEAFSFLPIIFIDFLCLSSETTYKLKRQLGMRKTLASNFNATV